jgi:hypothetical protein
MTSIGHTLGKIPGVPSYADRGRKKLRKALADYWSRYDADMIALVRSEIGWDFEPVKRHELDGQTWAEPLDSDGPWYPADGVPENPPELWGVPVALGYRDFGCLPEVPNTQFFGSPTQAGQATVAGALTLPSAGDAPGDTDDTGESGADRPDTQDLLDETETLLQDPEAAQNPGSVWTNADPPGADSESADDTAAETGDDSDGDSDDGDDADDSPDGLRARWRAWRERRAVAKRKKRARKGLQMMQRGSTALIVVQDGDSVLTCKPATYVTDTKGPEWYVTDDGKDKKYDAREAGSGPIALDKADIGMAFGPVPKLIAPVLPRIARNVHSLRVADNRAQFAPEQGGEQPQTPTNPQNGNASGDDAAVPDGGQVRHNDVIVEERALVWPADIKLLGGEHETQDHLDTLEEQVKALANPPGGEWLAKASKLGGIILAVLIGVTLGDPSGIIELIGGFL